MTCGIRKLIGLDFVIFNFPIQVRSEKGADGKTFSAGEKEKVPLWIYIYIIVALSHSCVTQCHFDHADECDPCDFDSECLWNPIILSENEVTRTNRFGKVIFGGGQSHFLCCPDLLILS